jgi:integrase/recombinase XerD
MLRFEDWPAADRAAWARLFAHGGLFDEVGRGCHWSKATVTCRRHYHERWLGFLSGRHPEMLARAQHARLTRELIAECWETLAAEGLRRVTIASLLDSLVQLHAAFDPELTPSWLRRLARTLMAESVADLDRPDYRITLDTIWYKALAALRALEESAEPVDMAEALAYRDRLILALLTFTLLRRENLTRLNLERDLTRSKDGWRVVIAAALVKNHREVVRLLPDSLGQHLDTYLARFRPMLLGERCSSSLWINYRGTPLQPNGVAKAIRRATHALFGITLRPHDLRRIATTTLATDAPEQIYLATQLLGHASRTVTERHYNRATSLTAGRRHAAALDELRRSLAAEMMEGEDGTAADRIALESNVKPLFDGFPAGYDPPRRARLE